MRRRLAIAASVGAVLGAAVTVAVFEWRGGARRASAQSTSRLGAAGEVGDPVTGDPVPVSSADARARDAADPVKALRDMRQRLAALEKQRSALEQDLTVARGQLAAVEGSSGGKTPKHEYDLGPEEWAELAKDRSIKYRIPCIVATPWKPDRADLYELRLKPDDGAVLEGAYVRSNKRLWGAIQPLCAKALGSAALADKLGPSTCTHLITDLAGKEDSEAVEEAMHTVGEIRSGQRPVPAAGEKLHPVLQLFLALTGEMKAFEDDVARSLGAEEAHRVAFSQLGICMSQSTFAGRTPKP